MVEVDLVGEFVVSRFRHPAHSGGSLMRFLQAELYDCTARRKVGRIERDRPRQPEGQATAVLTTLPIYLHSHPRLGIACGQGVHVGQDQLAGAVATEGGFVFPAEDGKSVEHVRRVFPSEVVEVEV